MKLYTRVIGVTRAKELIFTGKIISAEEVFQLGMINQVVVPDELMSTAEKLATEFSKKAPIAISLAEAAINKSFEAPMKVGLDYEVECFASCFATQDQKESILTGEHGYLVLGHPNPAPIFLCPGPHSRS